MGEQTGLSFGGVRARDRVQNAGLEPVREDFSYRTRQETMGIKKRES
jgi:hypothetical protein